MKIVGKTSEVGTGSMVKPESDEEEKEKLCINHMGIWRISFHCKSWTKSGEGKYYAHLPTNKVVVDKNVCLGVGLDWTGGLESKMRMFPLRKMGGVQIFLQSKTDMVP